MTVLVYVAPLVIIAAYGLACIKWPPPGLNGYTAGAGAVLTLVVIVVALALALATDTDTDYGPVLPALLVVFLVIAGIAYGRAEGATREHLATTAGIAVAAFDLDALSKPTAVLIPETVDGPFTGRVYRALPDPVAQVEGHSRGLVVFLDDAERILYVAQTDAYADGRKDQAADDNAELNRAWRHSSVGYVSDDDDPRMTIDDADILPIDRNEDPDRE